MADLITPQSNALANYSFNDISFGISNTVFYAGTWRNGNNVSGQIITNSTFYSDPIVLKTYRANQFTKEKLMTKNFDLSFGAPKTVNGDLVVNVPFGTGDAQGGANTQTVTLSGMILAYIVSGSVSTLLGNKSTSDNTFSITDTQQGAFMSSVRIPISNQRFKRNDILRLTVELWVTSQGGDHGHVFGIGCDPQNRNDADSQEFQKCFPDDVDTNFLIQVPLKIDV